VLAGLRAHALNARVRLLRCLAAATCSNPHKGFNTISNGVATLYNWWVEAAGVERQLPERDRGWSCDLLGEGSQQLSLAAAPSPLCLHARSCRLCQAFAVIIIELLLFRRQHSLTVAITGGREGVLCVVVPGRALPATARHTQPHHTPGFPLLPLPRHTNNDRHAAPVLVLRHQLCHRAGRHR
jgi:hypothetical protein